MFWFAPKRIVDSCKCADTMQFKEMYIFSSLKQSKSEYKAKTYKFELSEVKMCEVELSKTELFENDLNDHHFSFCNRAILMPVHVFFPRLSWDYSYHIKAYVYFNVCDLTCTNMQSSDFTLVGIVRAQEVFPVSFDVCPPITDVKYKVTVISALSGCR